MATTNKFNKTIVVPVAIPSCCGAFFIFISYFLRSYLYFKTDKTSVSLALAHIFGFGLTQSDDVHNFKKPAPVFIRNVVDLLLKHGVVVADKYVIYLFTFSIFCSIIHSYDRNNHLKQHHHSLRDATSKVSQPLRLLVLNRSLDQLPATIHHIYGDRVQQWCDNHQTLRADPSSKSHEENIWMFINNIRARS